MHVTLLLRRLFLYIHYPVHESRKPEMEIGKPLTLRFLCWLKPSFNLTSNFSHFNSSNEILVFNSPSIVNYTNITPAFKSLKTYLHCQAKKKIQPVYYLTFIPQLFSNSQPSSNELFSASLLYFRRNYLFYCLINSTIKLSFKISIYASYIGQLSPQTVTWSW